MKNLITMLLLLSILAACSTNKEIGKNPSDRIGGTMQDAETIDTPDKL